MLGKKIKRLRAQYNLTQEELAKELGVSRQAVAKWEIDGGMPDIENIKNLAEFFHQSLDEFINDVDETKLVKALTRRIMYLFLGVGLVTIFLINELTINNLIIWFLFISFMFIMSFLVRIMVLRFYNYQIKKKTIDKNDLGQLLVEGIGGYYLDPSNTFKAFLSRVRNYFENALILGYLHGLVLLAGHKIEAYQRYQEFAKQVLNIKEVSFELNDLIVIFLPISFYLLINIIAGEWKVFKHNHKNK